MKKGKLRITIFLLSVLAGGLWSACLFSEESRDAKGYLVFSKHYMERGDARTLPKPEEINKPLAIFASPGEYEPASFAIRTQKDLEAVTVTLAGDLAGPGGALISKEQVEIRCVELMKRWLSVTDYKQVECFLTRQKPRSISAYTTQRYWVTVHVPEQAKPGLYKTAITITPANAKPKQRLPSHRPTRNPVRCLSRWRFCRLASVFRKV